MTRRRALYLFWGALAIAAASCAPRPLKLMTLPGGPGDPAPDAASALEQATATCRALTTLSAEVAVRGSSEGRPIRGRLLAGVAAPASARLEAVAPFGPPLFIFVARDRDASLFLPRDRRLLEHARPEAVLEAVAGVPLDASELRAVLTACPARDAAEGSQGGRSIGADWRVLEMKDVVKDVGKDAGKDVGNDVVTYLNRESGSAPWRVVAMVYSAHGVGRASEDWRAEYRQFDDGLPRSVRLVCERPNRCDLGLTLSQVERNVPLGRDVFRVEPPPSTQPITLDEIRRARPGFRED